MNTCGVTSCLKIVFLFTRKRVGASFIATKQILSKTQKVSDKIKTDILPFLDNDIDDLDDEVAMISKKITGDGIDTEDIQINFDHFERGENHKTVEDEEEEKTRNFNTVPRNYSESKKQMTKQ